VRELQSDSDRKFFSRLIRLGNDEMKACGAATVSIQFHEIECCCSDRIDRECSAGRNECCSALNSDFNPGGMKHESRTGIQAMVADTVRSSDSRRSDHYRCHGIAGCCPSDGLPGSKSQVCDRE